MSPTNNDPDRKSGNRRQQVDDANSTAGGLSKRIEKLASEMESAPRGRSDHKTLEHLDELNRLLGEQRAELKLHADDASETLEACQQELAKKDDPHATLERLKAQQKTDRIRDTNDRDDRRKRAA